MILSYKDGNSRQKLFCTIWTNDRFSATHFSLSVLGGSSMNSPKCTSCRGDPSPTSNPPRMVFAFWNEHYPLPALISPGWGEEAIPH
ncbi:hypothetical protein AVEN_241580-1 [Araneus ventricosus]|uniref:Uncharacterized protein n=1 Tax=Araneus ventricosus TaxID=182803 RepID=A0A4Y2H8A6_ARAVE|nr:hypothetical protein AVEN_241580-1 [Araneus ventricosus]